MAKPPARADLASCCWWCCCWCLLRPRPALPLSGVHDDEDPEYSILKQRMVNKMKEEGTVVDESFSLTEITKIAERTITAVSLLLLCCTFLSGGASLLAWCNAMCTGSNLPGYLGYACALCALLCALDCSRSGLQQQLQLCTSLDRGCSSKPGRCCGF